MEEKVVAVAAHLKGTVRVQVIPEVTEAFPAAMMPILTNLSGR